MSSPYAPAYVTPRDPAEKARVEEQALRVRILDGQHRKDVEDKIEEAIAPEIAADLLWSVDLSANPFKSICTQLNVSYTTPGDIRISTDSGFQAPAPEDLDLIVTPYFWPLQQTRALYQMGVRECFVRLDWPSPEALAAGDTAEVTYRVVTPDCIHECRPHPRRPDAPAMVKEYRVRERTVTKDGQQAVVEVPTYDVWDVRDPSKPIFRIEEVTSQGTSDVTGEFYAGEGYPYKDRNGAPIFPYVLAHGRVQSRLWDYMEGVEVVQGTLKLAGGWTWWWDGFTNAANPQRVAIDLAFAGSRTETTPGGTNVESIPVSPKSVLLGKSSGPNSGRIDSFPPAMDPKGGVEALRAYEERLAIFAGLSPADIQVSSSAGMSGAAISISRDGLRKAQMAYLPAFRMADQQILATAARMTNAYANTDLPENPRAWAIDYATIGESPTERKVKVETVQAEISVGVLNRVGAIRRLSPTVETDEEAIQEIASMAAQDALAALAERKALEDVAAEVAPSPSPSDAQASADAADAIASLEAGEEMVALLRSRITDPDMLTVLDDLEEVLSDAADLLSGSTDDSAEGEEVEDA